MCNEKRTYLFKLIGGQDLTYMKTKTVEEKITPRNLSYRENVILKASCWTTLIFFSVDENRIKLENTFHLIFIFMILITTPYFLYLKCIVIFYRILIFLNNTPLKWLLAKREYPNGK